MHIVDDSLPIDSSQSPPPQEPLDSVVIDPPPPYPSRVRRPRAARPSRHAHQIQTSHTQFSSAESYSDQELSPHVLLGAHGPFSDDHDDAEALETTPFLHRAAPRRRPRSFSNASTTSVAPSLAQTVFSLFRTEDESDFSEESERRLLVSTDGQAGRMDTSHRHQDSGFFSFQSWSRYFRPLSQKVYYRSLFHLMVVNFPYALAAWVYLFVFTVAGTTLLMALPLGAILCFFNLLGARAFARGELALQTKFHSPLSYPAPYPSRPIFSRFREASSAEVEAGSAVAGDLVRERSFYKNSYAMFTDPTSYQALFYFLVIKPSITLVFSLVLIIFALPSLLLVLLAPAALRAVRRLGIWQANVAIEGLYLAVR